MILQLKHNKKKEYADQISDKDDHDRNDDNDDDDEMVVSEISDMNNFT